MQVVNGTIIYMIGEREKGTKNKYHVPHCASRFHYWLRKDCKTECNILNLLNKKNEYKPIKLIPEA